MNIVTLLVAHITILGYAYCANGTSSDSVLEVTTSSNTNVTTNTTTKYFESEESTATNDNETYNLTIALRNLRNLNRTSIPRINRKSVGSSAFRKTNTSIANNFFIGNSTEFRRVHRKDLYKEGIPLMRREYIFAYELPEDREIKAIECLDYLHSEAEVDLVMGGVGFPYAIIVITSQRSVGLYFGIEIFA